MTVGGSLDSHVGLGFAGSLSKAFIGRQLMPSTQSLHLPRDVAFKRSMTALLTVIPDPREPAHAQFAKIWEPIVDDFQQCERGIKIKIQDRVINVTCRLHSILGLGRKSHPT